MVLAIMAMQWTQFGACHYDENEDRTKRWEESLGGKGWCDCVNVLSGASERETEAGTSEHNDQNK